MNYPAEKNTAVRRKSTNESPPRTQQNQAGTLPMSGIRLFEFCDIDRASAPLERRASEDCIEILYMHKGIQVFQIGGRELIVSGGEMLVVPAGETYSTGNHPQYKCSYHRLMIATDDPVLLGFSPEHSAALRRYLSTLTDYRYYGNARLGSLLGDAFSHILAGSAAARNQGCGELICFLASLENALSSHSPQRAHDMEIVLQYINEHITENITLSELAQLIGSSLSYFKERFTSLAGVSPMYYINWRKIAFAKRMIVQDYSVTQVAAMLGFATPAYFSTVFKNYTSRTPMQYKQIVDIELKKQRHISPATHVI